MYLNYFVELLKYIFMGLVQGVAEVLPISSSAHLAICGTILGIEDNSVAFRIFLHFASLIATCFFLRKRLWQLIKGFFRFIFKKDKSCAYEFHYCLKIVVATIPCVIITLLIGDYIDKANETLWLIGLFLMINAFVLFGCSFIKPREDQNITYLDALVVGGFQCFGLLSGISRSGSCMDGAMVRRLNKENVADFVFLMLIPAVLGATVLEFKDIASFALSGGVETISLYAISFIVTLVVTYFSFKLLLVLIRKSKFIYFSIYCFVVGLAVMIYGLLNK